MIRSFALASSSLCTIRYGTPSWVSSYHTHRTAPHGRFNHVRGLLGVWYIVLLRKETTIEAWYVCMYMYVWYDDAAASLGDVMPFGHLRYREALKARRGGRGDFGVTLYLHLYLCAESNTDLCVGARSGSRAWHHWQQLTLFCCWMTSMTTLLLLQVLATQKLAAQFGIEEL